MEKKGWFIASVICIILFFTLYTIGIFGGYKQGKESDAQISQQEENIIQLTNEVDAIKQKQEETQEKLQAISISLTDMFSEITENKIESLGSFERALLLINTTLDIIVGIDDKQKCIDERVLDIETMWEALNFGKFTATAYSPFDNVSGIENDGEPEYTATGTYPTWGTFAVDPDIIPYGSKIIVIGEDFIEHGVALDTGGTMRKYDYWIDLYRDYYWETVDFGKQEVIVIWEEVN